MIKNSIPKILNKIITIGLWYSIEEATQSKENHFLHNF